MLPSSQILLATTNHGKIREFRELLREVGDVRAPGDESFRHLACPEVEEDGSTYFENALKKAIAFQKVYGCPVLADDSGLEVDALDGAPGVFSARFGGMELSWPQRWEALRRKLEGNPTPWTARFRCVLCYFDGKGVPRFFEGVSDGEVLAAPVGTGGFGYDPIIRIGALGKTFGEATPLEKQTVSHRAVASRAFVSWWRKVLKD